MGNAENVGNAGNAILAGRYEKIREARDTDSVKMISV